MRKAEWRHDSAHFPLIAVTGYRSCNSHAVRRVELSCFVRFGQPVLLCTMHISLLKQKRITS